MTLFRDLRRANQDKKKKPTKPWLIITIVILVLLVLAGLGVGIYFLARPATKTTRSPCESRFDRETHLHVSL